MAWLRQLKSRPESDTTQISDSASATRLRKPSLAVMCCFQLIYVPRVGVVVVRRGVVHRVVPALVQPVPPFGADGQAELVVDPAVVGAGAQGGDFAGGCRELRLQEEPRCFLVGVGPCVGVASSSRGWRWGRRRRRPWSGCGAGCWCRPWGGRRGGTRCGGRARRRCRARGGRRGRGWRRGRAHGFT